MGSKRGKSEHHPAKRDKIVAANSRLPPQAGRGANRNALFRKKRVSVPKAQISSIEKLK